MPNDELPAGPELDAIIATKVMGWAITSYAGCQIIVRPGLTVNGWSPSTNMKDAWEVVEYMTRTTRQHCELRHGSCYESACFDLDGREFYADATTMPHAICLAALKVGDGLRAP